MRIGLAGRVFVVALAVVGLTAACSPDDNVLMPAGSVAPAHRMSSSATRTHVPGQEPFTPARLGVGNQLVTVTGYRTDMETVIDIAMPPGIRLTGEPSLMIGGYAGPVAGGGQEQEGGTPVASTEAAHKTDGKLELHFGPSPRGAAVAVNLGVFAADPNVPSVEVTVAVGEVLQRNHATLTNNGSYPVEPGDVLDGPSGLALSVDQPEGYLNGIKQTSVGITVKGFWRVEVYEPELFDQDGHELVVRNISANDIKTEAGDVLPDKTIISTDVSDLSTIKTLKVVLGPPQDVETWARSVVLQPQP